MVEGEKERLATVMVRQRGSPASWRRAAAMANPRDDEPLADKGGPLRAAGGADRAVRVAGGYGAAADRGGGGGAEALAARGGDARGGG